MARGRPSGREKVAAVAASDSGSQARAAQAFTRQVKSASPSASVWARVSDGVLDLWAVIPERDRAVEKAIAAAACELMRSYVELDLDFMVVAVDSPSAAGLAGAGYTRVGRRGAG